MGDLLKVLGQLQEENPRVAEAIINLRKSIMESSALDPKTANLVTVGIATAIKNQDALLGHIQLAKQAGASRDEVVSAILLAIPSGGVPAALAALPLAWENYR